MHVAHSKKQELNFFLAVGSRSAGVKEKDGVLKRDWLSLVSTWSPQWWFQLAGCSLAVYSGVSWWWVGGYHAPDSVCMWVLAADEGKACIWPIYPYCCWSVDVRRGGCPSVDLRWLLVCTSTKCHHIIWWTHSVVFGFFFAKQLLFFLQYNWDVGCFGFWLTDCCLVLSWRRNGA